MNNKKINEHYIIYINSAEKLEDLYNDEYLL